jgi:SlyX protein
MTDEERIVKLEEIVAHQTKTIDDLSDQLARQWTTIDHVRSRLDTLVERFLSLEEQSREAPPVTPPPHY